MRRLNQENRQRRDRLADDFHDAQRRILDRFETRTAKIRTEAA